MKTLRQGIVGVLRRYRVQKHYQASRDAKVTRYAVYDDSGQLTEPKRYAEANADREDLVVRDLLGLLE